MKTKTVHKIGKKILSSYSGKRVYYFLCKILYFLIPDKLYLRIMFLLRTGKFLRLKNPQTFNEKLQWLKVYYRLPVLTKLSDKYAVREYVKEKVGSGVLIPLIGVYESFDDINFDKLPKSFILKANHASGWNIICNDIGKFDINSARKDFKLWLKTNYYYPGRCWAYKNIKPLIVCEEFISSKDKLGLDDYKVHCFNGKPVYIQFITDRHVGLIKESFYDLNWKMQKFTLTYPMHKNALTKPCNLDEMISISEKLSNGLPYCRVDLYNCAGKIYFGEITLIPANGMDNFTPDMYNKVLGDLLDLNGCKTS